MRIAYKCHISQQEGGEFLVTFPELEEAMTEGSSLEEALFNAEEALTLTLEGRIDEGQDVPRPVEDAEILPPLYLVFPSPKVQAALLVRLIRSEKSLAELARSLETSWPAASRLEDPHHWSSLRQLTRVAEVFGGRLVLSFEMRETKRGSSIVVPQVSLSSSGELR
jgi:antitoxin HicB